jgi:RNA-binding protein 39
LIRFFEQAGPVRDAQIVKDRISGRSKGVGYVEFKSAETVPAALALTGQLLLGLPVIAQLTEAEKNRQAREGAPSASKSTVPLPDAPFHRLYIGNVHFNIGEEDLRAVFEPFGEIEHVSLQIDGDTGRSRGFGFVQFKDAAHAREALETMNGFELAGRAIRVGFGNDNVKVGTDAASAAALANAASEALAPPSRKGESERESSRRGDDRDREYGRDRDRNRDRDREYEGGRRSKDEDNRRHRNISRTELMRKLARAEDGIHAQPEPTLVDHAKSPTAARGVLLKNMFNPAEETGSDWTTELAEDVKAECEEKYGTVVHIHVEEHSLGEIYVKFKTLEGGKKAIEGLNGRWFGGRTIGASALLDAIYHSKFPETKQL